MIPVPKNKLQEQFEFEQRRSQKAGVVSSLTFEEWLKAKEKNERVNDNSKQ